jgi:Tol biopolymer transport system component
MLNNDPALQDQFGQLPVPHGALFTINPDGSDLKGITSAGGSSSVADWSPDGREIAYLTMLEDTNNDGKADARLPEPVLYIQGADGKAQRVSLGDKYRFGWSLDW